MIRVRHDAEIEIEVTPRYGPLPAITERTTARHLEGALTRLSYMYVGCSGNSIGSAAVKYRLVNPEDVLTDGEECPCTECKGGTP